MRSGVCAALRGNPEIPVRMGIHSGPLNSLPDVNDRASVAGAGIKIARRVMDFADAGQILVSKRVAEDFLQSGHWRGELAILKRFRRNTVWGFPFSMLTAKASVIQQFPLAFASCEGGWLACRFGISDSQFNP
jgi:hypothetical protein